MALMPIERGKVREYATATANARPEYLDDPQAPIPPTFLATVVFWSDELHDVLDTPEVLAACAEMGIGSDVRSLLSLEQEYVFHGGVPQVGQTLTTSTRFDGIETKSGSRSRMVLVHFALEFRDPDSHELRAECLYTSAFRAAEAVVS